jgi:2',3'-cyclic-nucleotide 2'-phosphodiesterase (5'-nucleotidase family)
MATLIKRLRAMDKNVLALDAGDVFVGSFEFNKFLGYPQLKIMEGLYDAMELGNHEFDLTIDTLAGVLSGYLAGGPPVTLPILCANVNFAGTSLDGMVSPTKILNIGGMNIGILGLVTQEPQNYSKAVNDLFPYPYQDPDPTKTLWYFAAQKAGELKAQCDVVICLSHLGTSLDMVLADNVPNIDVIVGGHSHDVFDQAVIRNGKIIVQAGEFGKYLGELKLNVDNKVVTLDSWKLHRVDGRVKEDPKVRGIVNQVVSGVVKDPRFGPVYTQLVARALRDITKNWPAGSQNRDTPLGNMVTDAFKKGLIKAGYPVDVALDVMGYEGAPIFAGKVVGNNILRAVPYGYDPVSGLDFKVVIVPLTPGLLLGGLEYAADMVTDTTDLAVQASGVTYSYDSTQPKAPDLLHPTRLDVMSVMVNGDLVAAHLEDPEFPPYMVAMSEQVFGFLNDLLKPMGIDLEPYIVHTNMFEYNLVRDYMKALKFVHYKSEGRIKDVPR